MRRPVSGSRLAQHDRKEDQKGKRRTSGQDDGERNRRRKGSTLGNDAPMAAQPICRKPSSADAEPGLPSKRMERDRGAERIDQSHPEQIQRDGHGEGHEGRCGGEREHGDAASECDEEADHADGALTPAMSQARREKTRQRRRSEPSSRKTIRAERRSGPTRSSGRRGRPRRKCKARR